MNLKHILLVPFVFGLFSGCSDKDGSSSEQNKLPTSNIPEIIKHCNGEMQCVCDSIHDIDSYDYKGEKYFCNRKNVLKTAIPPSSNERGVKKIIPILEESHNHCKGEAQYNECFCKKSNFSGSVTIGNTKYHCR